MFLLFLLLFGIEQDFKFQMQKLDKKLQLQNNSKSTQTTKTIPNAQQQTNNNQTDQYTAQTMLNNTINRFSNECPCNGIEITLPDQEHCFEIISGTGGSWVAADQRCSSQGGFLAHFQEGAILNSALLSYIDQNYQKPLLTGATIGNIDTMRVALMCPNNQFYELLNQSYVTSYFLGTPSSTQRCTFLENSDNKFHYLSCDTDADIICDRPLQQTSYCNIMINCSTTTTTVLPITTPMVSSSSIVISTNTNNNNNNENNEDDNCGKGYTRVFGWCVPWWAWLLFGLLLLLLLCCLLGWLIHCCCRLCLCWLPKETVYVEKKYVRKNVEVQTELGTTEESVPIIHTVVHEPKINKQVPPLVIYDVTVYENNFNKELIVPPAPYYSTNNPAMLLPPPQEQDAISAAPPSPMNIAVHKNHHENVSPMPTKEIPYKFPHTEPMIRYNTHEKIPHKFPPPPPILRDDSPEKSPILDLRRSVTPPPEPTRQIRRHSADITSPIIHKQPSSPARSPFEVPESSPEPLILPPLPPVRKKKLPKRRSTSQPTKRNMEFSKQPIASDARSFPKPPSKRSINRSSTPPLSKPPIERTPASFSRRPISKSPPNTRPFPKSPPSEQPTPKNPSRKRRTSDRSSNKEYSLMQSPMKSPNNAGFRSARGRLGGVSGGRLGDRPDGWKPWAKSPNVFSGHPGFLDEGD